MDEQSRTKRKMTAKIATVIVLALCLIITTLALALSILSVEDNLFRTGIVKINLNDKKPVIEEYEFLFEPGMTVVKPFFVENESTCDVYYRLYFMNVAGGLADVLEVKICDGDAELYSGKLSELTKENVGASNNLLAIGERRELTITFHFPEDAGNEAQSLYLNFDLAADAVQTKNNPSGLFE